MIIVKHILDVQNNISIFKNNDKSMIIDIETTGFSPRFANIYLIGMFMYDAIHDQFILEQWLCEKDRDEYELLYKFNQKLEAYNHIYHYNGDRFDMPFIKKRMHLYTIDCNDFISHDFLKLIRPFKSILKLDNLKLKTIESYFGYNRSDPFSGGELINLYTDYKESLDERLMKVLLLHNYEDILGLKKVVDHYLLFDFLEQLKNKLFSPTIDSIDSTTDKYHVIFDVPISETLTLKHNLFTLKIDYHKAFFTTNITTGALKYFFNNPNDYYYLPTEDYAIHKSVGKYVDKNFREPARKETCYIKKEGTYLPSYKRLNLLYTHYYKSYKDTLGYIPIDELTDHTSIETYIKELLSLI